MTLSSTEVMNINTSGLNLDFSNFQSSVLFSNPPPESQLKSSNRELPQSPSGQLKNTSQLRNNSPKPAKKANFSSESKNSSKKIIYNPFTSLKNKETRNITSDSKAQSHLQNISTLSSKDISKGETQHKVSNRFSKLKFEPGPNLLSEINQILLTHPIVDEEENSFSDNDTTLTASSVSEEIKKRLTLNPTLKTELNTIAPNLFEYFEAPVAELHEALFPKTCLEPTFLPKTSKLSTVETLPEIQTKISEPLTLEKNSTQVNFQPKPQSTYDEKSVKSESVPKLPTGYKSSLSKYIFTKNLIKPNSKAKNKANKVSCDTITKPKQNSKLTEIDIKPERGTFFKKFTKKNPPTFSKSAPILKQSSPTPSESSQETLNLFDPFDLPLHKEQQLYTISHQKIAEARRPMHQQLIISNLMRAYLIKLHPNLTQAPVNRVAPARPTSHLISKRRYRPESNMDLDSSDEEDSLLSSDDDSDDEELLGNIKYASLPS